MSWQLEPEMPWCTVIAEGDRLFRQGDFDKALGRYNCVLRQGQLLSLKSVITFAFRCQSLTSAISKIEDFSEFGPLRKSISRCRPRVEE